jgi:hypothetical protein
MEVMAMWWECSECGGQVESERSPVLCRECGTAGVIFVPVDVEDPFFGVPGANSLRDVWLRAGVDLARQEVLR